MKIINFPFENAVISKTHESLYLMHKYWARKPANVVSEYIKYFTNEGDVVLDPFCGSGVTVIESAKLNRKAIYNDLSKTATFIAEQTAIPIDIKLLENCFFDIYNSVKDEINGYYETICSNCHAKAITTHVIWMHNKLKSNDNMLLVKSLCPSCNSKQERAPLEDDVKLMKRINSKTIKYWYPQTKLIPNGRLLVSEDMSISNLYTHRALLSLSLLYSKIESIKDKILKKMMQFIFTSSLSQSSKLVPVISSKGRENEVGSWSLPGFWIPDKYFEINVLNCFYERFKKIKRGKQLINYNFDNITFISKPASDLDTISSESIDYIFTDPPYGDSVPYFEYQLIWASWLKHKLDFDNEVVISDSKSRNKDLDNYKDLLSKSFNELYRVLKPNAWMTVTFHNSHIKVWNALVSSVFEAGFLYENDCYVLTGRKSTNQLMRESGSMTGDIYINFKKPIKKSVFISKELSDIKNEVFKESEKVIIERGGQATTDQLARGILMKLSKNNLFGNILELKLSDILSERFEYNSDVKIWTIKENKEAKLLEYIPLETRISSLIDSILNSDKSTGYELDEFLVPIFTKYKNGRTPDTRDIIHILKNKAKEKKGKWFPSDVQELFDTNQYIQPIQNTTDEIKYQTEHNAIIYQLAKIGLKQNYNVWIGENEKRKSVELNKLSMKELIIPGVSSETIVKSRINQIDLIWLNYDKSSFILFEVENSTRMINCIPRLANLTETLPHLKIPIYIVIPDNLVNKANKSFNDPSNLKLINSDRHIIVYSKLFDKLELLENNRLNIVNFLEAVSDNI